MVGDGQELLVGEFGHVILTVLGFIRLRFWIRSIVCLRRAPFAVHRNNAAFPIRILAPESRGRHSLESGLAAYDFEVPAVSSLRREEDIQRGVVCTTVIPESLIQVVQDLLSSGLGVAVGGDVGETGEGSPLCLPDDCEGLKLARHAVSHKDNLRTILIERRRVSAGNLLSLGRVDRHPAFVKGSFTS